MEPYVELIWMTQVKVGDNLRINGTQRIVTSIQIMLTSGGAPYYELYFDGYPDAPFWIVQHVRVERVL